MTPSLAARATMSCGDSGADKIHGGDGNDTIRGGFGSDTMTGGEGDDLFEIWVSGTSGNDVITDFDVANDTIKFGGEGGPTSSFDTGNGVMVGRGYYGGDASDARNYDASVFVQGVTESQFWAANLQINDVDYIVPKDHGDNVQDRYAGAGADAFDFETQAGGEFHIHGFDPTQDTVDIWHDMPSNPMPGHANAFSDNYEEVYGTYRDSAYEALNDDYIPLGMKGLVKDYFSSLDPEQ